MTHPLAREQASEKRQGTKSRSVYRGGAAELYGELSAARSRHDTDIAKRSKITPSETWGAPCLWCSLSLVLLVFGAPHRRQSVPSPALRRYAYVRTAALFTGLRGLLDQFEHKIYRLSDRITGIKKHREIRRSLGQRNKLSHDADKTKID